MDEGFLSAIMRSTHFPPNDMWLSGYPINYYYYAHYTIALLAKLLGQPSAIAFNTGICMFFGLTAVNIFGVTSNIVAWASHRQRQSVGGSAKRSRFAALQRRSVAGSRVRHVAHDRKAAGLGLVQRATGNGRRSDGLSLARPKGPPIRIFERHVR